MHIRRSMIWRIKGIWALILFTFLLFPTLVFSGEKEDVVLKEYFDALSRGDLTRVSSLLSPSYKYYYYKNDELRILGHNEELKSLEQLFKDARTNSFNEPSLYEKDKNSDNKFYVKFLIGFEDSPNTYTDSLFRGALLEIDETLTVTLDNNKILKIVEEKDKGSKKKLSFGFLKYIHSGNTEENLRETKDELIIELREKKNKELLLIKEVLVLESGGVEETYYWPNRQIIANFL